MLTCDCGKPALYQIKHYSDDLRATETRVLECKDCLDKKTNEVLDKVSDVHIYDITGKYMHSIGVNR